MLEEKFDGSHTCFTQADDKNSHACFDIVAGVCICYRSCHNLESVTNNYST